jgi:hypothetical protein
MSTHNLNTTKSLCIKVPPSSCQYWQCHATLICDANKSTHCCPVNAVGSQDELYEPTPEECSCKNLKNKIKKRQRKRKKKIKLKDTNYTKILIKKNAEMYNTSLYQHITDHLFSQVLTSNNGQGQLQKLQEVT